MTPTTRFGAAALVAGLLGLAVGVGGATQVQPAAPAPAPPGPAAATVEDPPPVPCDDLGGLRARVAERLAEVEAAEATWAAVAQANAMAEGTPLAWPETLPPGYDEASYRATLEGLIDADPAITLLGIDCGEYPCIAQIRTVEEDPSVPHHWVDLIAGMEAAGLDTAHLFVGGSMDVVDGQGVFTQAFGHYVGAAEGKERVTLRRQDAVQDALQ